jgi:NAD(P)-dependent dehydrogenase (short-subunit alcohol dehydrogenase family)
MTALITGASGGLGRALAAECAARGYDLFLTDLSEQGLLEIKHGIQRQYNVAVHTGPQPGQWGIAESGMRVRHLNLSHPDHSLALRAPLAEGAGGLEMCVGNDGAPVFTGKDDPDYRRIHRALTEGVIVRDQPGVREILAKRKVAKRVGQGPAQE